MELVLTRIDSRLIHGQVATSWVKATKPEAIFAVNDDVAEDKIRKSLLLQVAPEGVKSFVITVEKAIAVYKNPKYDKTKVMLLVTCPADVVRLIEGGIDIKTVNVGGMTFKEGDKLISKAVAINKQDLEAFNKLRSMGVELDMRQLVTSAKEDINSKLDSISFD